jgi:ornithine carbamoyltransferase
MHSLLASAAEFKRAPHRRRDLLELETVVLYFNKPSTRTRISFETAIARLGGTPVSVGSRDVQLGRGETIEDTAGVIGRYARAFVIRTFSDDDVARFAAASSIPVINALTDGHHPCQSVADLMTLAERRGTLAGLRLAYVGDGNNVSHSLLEACSLVGMRVSVATPAAYAPSGDVVDLARELAAANGGEVVLTEDPREAVRGADAVYTATWLSMGHDESEKQQRLQALEPYRVDSALMRLAGDEAIFMHCLPSHRGEEVTAEVADGPRSVIFDQAENRLHTAAAILEALIDGRLSGRRAAGG